LVQEIDCVRIISESQCEIIQSVNVSSENIFRFGSEAPSAILYEAREQFDLKSSKSEEFIRSIRMNLRTAVDECLEAAGWDFSVENQKSLLKAASFGKSFLDIYPTARFVDMCNDIKVLNSLRTPKIGIPLTFTQYRKLTPEKVVMLLCSRSHYGLAKSICELLNLPLERVLIHWACYKVRNSVNDEDILSREIFNKLSEISGISYVQIAEEAYNAGKIKLATNVFLNLHSY
jgi:hypothetical protein